MTFFKVAEALSGPNIASSMLDGFSTEPPRGTCVVMLRAPASLAPIPVTPQPPLPFFCSRTRRSKGRPL
ncbi:hypothetical protein D3C73_1627670 [compost metagenome]